MTITGGGSAVSPALEPLPRPDEIEPPFASWGRRVAATLLDQALLTGATFLLFPVQPVDPPTLLNAGVTHQVGGVWTDSGWYVALVTVMVLMQAYLGSTPGKLVVGIAVVSDADLRPGGLVRTLLRELAHVVDALLFMIGYLRPLWHRERRTFADSLARTVVLRTSAPLPWALNRGQTPPAVWESAAQPRWRRVATWVSTAAVVLGAVYGYGPMSSTTHGVVSSTCSASALGTTTEALSAGTLEVRDAPERMTRLGVERETAWGGPAGVEVRWQIDGLQPTDGTLRLRLTSGSTGVSRTIDHRVEFGQVVAGRGEPVADGDLGVVLPLSVLDGLAPDWTWELTVVEAGVESPPCRGA